MNAYEIAKLVYFFLGAQLSKSARDAAVHPVSQLGALDEADLRVSLRTDSNKIRTYRIKVKLESEE